MNHFGASWIQRRNILEPSWASWNHFGSSWGRFRALFPSWAYLASPAAISSRFGVISGRLNAYLARLGPILVRLGAISVRLGAILRPSGPR